MVEVISTANRISSDDMYELFKDKYVLLGYTEDDEYGNTISGIPIAVAEREDREAMWKLFIQCLEKNEHGELLLDYYGVVETIGVYV